MAYFLAGASFSQTVQLFLDEPIVNVSFIGTMAQT